MSEVTILASADRHLLQIYRWLEEQEEGLGDAFDADFQAVCVLLAENPEIAMRHDPIYRRYLLSRWSMGIFYTVTGNRVLIGAVADVRQSPDTIRRILTELN